MASSRAAASATADHLFTVLELSDYLQIPVGTLYVWRYRRTGPKGSRVGKHVRYRKSDVDAWLLEQQQQDEAGAA